MRALLILALLCPAAWSHSVDLAGPWRISPPGDDPGWARPDFDDSSWKFVQVPLGERSLTLPERYWLRRQVSLPDAAEAEPLTITVGAVSEFYEVFVNGVSVGKSQAFDIPMARLARPQTFDIPEFARKPMLQTAIRIWNPLEGQVPGLWRVRDRGPWLIADLIAAPRNAGIQAIQEHRLRRSSDLIQVFPALTAAAVVLLVWFGNHRRHDLLWLFVYVVGVCVGRLDLFLQISPEAQPFERIPLRLVEFGLVPAVLFAQFVSSTFGLRWLPRLVWPVFAITSVCVLSELGRSAYLAGIWTVQLCTLAALVQAALDNTRSEAHRNARYVLLAVLLSCFYFHGTSWGVWRDLGIPDRRTVEVFGVLVYLHTAFLTLIALFYALSQVRSVVGDRVRLASEFEAARVLQQLLLRNADLHSGEYEIRAVYRPAQEVGGDFYQLARLDDGGVLILVGDVSGKGLHAAMVVSTIIGAFRRERSSSPADVLAGLNDVLAGQTGNGFVTACCLLVRPEGDVLLANAGHPPPYSGGRELEVEAGMPLGVVPGTVYSNASFHMQPGESLTLVSDGVPEAAKKGQLFGFERTCEISRKPAAEIADAAEMWGQKDDITVLKVQRAAA